MKRAIAWVAATLLLSAACSDPEGNQLNGPEQPSMITVEGVIQVINDVAADEATVTLATVGQAYALEGPLVTELAELDGVSVKVHGMDHGMASFSRKALFYRVIEVDNYVVLN